jgi:hypothetical protein
LEEMRLETASLEWGAKAEASWMDARAAMTVQVENFMVVLLALGRVKRGRIWNSAIDSAEFSGLNDG